MPSLMEYRQQVEGSHWFIYNSFIDVHQQTEKMREQFNRGEKRVCRHKTCVNILLCITTMQNHCYELAQKNQTSVVLFFTHL